MQFGRLKLLNFAIAGLLVMRRDPATVENTLPALVAPPGCAHSRAWLHSAQDRVLGATLGAWQVRVLPDSRVAYCLTRGFWHIQLWNPEYALSVLTPSRLSAGFYELYTGAHWLARGAEYDEFATLAADVCGFSLPAEAELLRMEDMLRTDALRDLGLSAS